MEKGRLVCCECLAVADERAKSWRAYRADVPGEDPEPIVLLFCPSCATREFGPFDEAVDRAGSDRAGS